MKNNDHFNNHLKEMLEFLELEKQISKDFIPRVYEAQVNCLLKWAKGIPKLSNYLNDFQLNRKIKVKKVVKLFNQKIANNKAQLSAVEKSISEQYPIVCIQGPPGTGKTSVIVEIIKQELKKYPKKKILISSQSNLAVDNVLEKLLESKKIKILRLGQEQKVSRPIQPYLLENIKSKLYFHNSLKNMAWSVCKFIALSPLLLLSKNPKFYAKKKKIIYLK